MGFMKDIKGMVGGAQQLQQQGDAMAAQAAGAQQAGAGGFDPSQPQWAPIEGVTVEQYAAITAGLVRDGIQGIPDVEAYAEQRGVPSGRWATVQQGWTQRMAQHLDVRTRYGMLYAKGG